MEIGEASFGHGGVQPWWPATLFKVPPSSLKGRLDELAFMGEAEPDFAFGELQSSQSLGPWKTLGSAAGNPVVFDH